jgi:ketosteroid isomerase-like protein
MSRENVELVRRAFDAFNRRDLDAFLARMDADVEAVSQLVAIEGGYHGHDGMRRWWDSVLGVAPDLTYELVEVRDPGDLTVAAVRNRGHGAGSDVPFDQTLWQVARWRDKKIVWWKTYGTEAEAFEAGGLSEYQGRRTG